MHICTFAQHINHLGIALLFFTVYFESQAPAALLCVPVWMHLYILAWSNFLTLTAHLVWHHRPHTAHCSYCMLHTTHSSMHTTHCSQCSVKTTHCSMQATHCSMQIHISFGVMPSTASPPVDAADFKMHWWKRWQFGLWQCAISISLPLPIQKKLFKMNLQNTYTQLLKS